MSRIILSLILLVFAQSALPKGGTDGDFTDMYDNVTTYNCLQYNLARTTEKWINDTFKFMHNDIFTKEREECLHMLKDDFMSLSAEIETHLKKRSLAFESLWEALIYTKFEGADLNTYTIKSLKEQYMFNNKTLGRMLRTARDRFTSYKYDCLAKQFDVFLFTKDPICEKNYLDKYQECMDNALPPERNYIDSVTEPIIIEIENQDRNLQNIENQLITELLPVKRLDFDLLRLQGKLIQKVADFFHLALNLYLRNNYISELDDQILECLDPVVGSECFTMPLAEDFKNDFERINEDLSCIVYVDHFQWDWENIAVHEDFAAPVKCTYLCKYKAAFNVTIDGKDLGQRAFLQDMCSQCRAMEDSHRPLMEATKKYEDCVEMAGDCPNACECSKIMAENECDLPVCKGLQNYFGEKMKTCQDYPKERVTINKLCHEKVEVDAQEECEKHVCREWNCECEEKCEFWIALCRTECRICREFCTTCDVKRKEWKQVPCEKQIDQMIC